MEIDFKEIAQRLLARAETLVPIWLPGGKKSGREYVCGSIEGGKGESFSVNMETGVWAEFNGNMQKGGDLISLYAAQNNIKQIEAARRLIPETGLSIPDQSTVTGSPTDKEPAFKKASHVWNYHDKDGRLVAKIARIEKPDGKKAFQQAHFNSDGVWEYRAHPQPRPIYHLDKLRPDDVVLVCEGEKTADAAQKIVGKAYFCTCWMGGCQAVDKSDWSVIHGHRVLLLPDNDLPGIQAMQRIASLLYKHCPEIKVVDITKSGKPEGWDVADEPMSWGQFVALFKPLIHIYEPTHNPLTNEPLSLTSDTTPSTTEAEIVSDGGDTGLWLSMGLQMGGNGRPINNMVTVKRILSYDPALRGQIWYDIFYQNIFIKSKPINTESIINLTFLLQEKYGIAQMDDTIVRKALIHVASQNQRCEPMDWLKTLKWDGVDRISQFFATYYGSPDDEYHSDVARYFWAGLAARLINPGCQLDCMIVLQGAQGKYKSTSLRIIGGKWYAESANEIGTTNFLQSLHGKLLMEIGELSSFKKAHIEAIKNTLSMQTDHIRIPYAPAFDDFPRICVLSGTTNEDDFLADDTGARRFYPISIVSCDIQRLKADREQLFAQAKHIAETDENWWFVKTDGAESIQESRRIADPWEEVVTMDAIKNANLDIIDGLKITDISDKILKIPAERTDRVSSRRIASILKKIGLRRIVSKLDNRKSIRLWRVEQSGGWVDNQGVYYDTKCNKTVEFDE